MDLNKLLPKFLLFFADEGGGAPGGGGDPAPAGGGGAAVAEGEEPTPGGEPAPGGEGGEPTAGDGEEEKLPGDTSDDEHPERDDIEEDGRKMDKRTKSLIDKLSKSADPEMKEAAKTLREAHFQKQAVLKEFPEAKGISEAVREIRNMKATLEAVGGDEGITNLQDEVNDYRGEIDQFAKGDRKLIEQLYEANPESTMLAARNSLDVLASKDMKLYDQAILPGLVKRLDQAEFSKSIKEICQFCLDGKGQEAFDKAQSLLAWDSNLKKLAGDLSKNQETVDPRKQELDNRENAVKEKEARFYEQTIGNSVTKLNNTSLGTVLTSNFWKEVGWLGKEHGENRREFTQNLQNRIWAAMKADKTFQRNAHALKSKGDADRTAQFIADKFEELLPDHFRKYKNIKFPSMGARPKAKEGGAPGAGAGNNGKGPTPPAGVLLVAKKPAPPEIDWSPGKTTDAMFNIGGNTGQAFRKSDGKKVQWDWAAQ